MFLSRFLRSISQCLNKNYLNAKGLHFLSTHYFLLLYFCCRYIFFLNPLTLLAINFTFYYSELISTLLGILCEVVVSYLSKYPRPCIDTAQVNITQMLMIIMISNKLVICRLVYENMSLMQ